MRFRITDERSEAHLFEDILDAVRVRDAYRECFSDDEYRIEDEAGAFIVVGFNEATVYEFFLTV